jgi:hypothetical protein
LGLTTFELPCFSGWRGFLLIYGVGLLLAKLLADSVAAKTPEDWGNAKIDGS